MAQTDNVALFLGDCPRCGTVKTTFNVLASAKTDYNKDLFESFMLCRSCYKPSNARLKKISNSFSLDNPSDISGQFINNYFNFIEWVFEIPNSRSCPTHVPEKIARLFEEGASCLAINAFDAAGTMFRKVLDASTRSLTPSPESEAPIKPNSWKTFKDLRLRLDWLFENKLLDPSLKDLSLCIHQDGNDAAHDIEGIGEIEAYDLVDFTEQVLKIIYTIPGQIEENKARRELRRSK